MSEIALSEKRPKDMTDAERAEIPVRNPQGFAFDLSGPGVRGDDLMFYTDQDGEVWHLDLGAKGWYRYNTRF